MAFNKTTKLPRYVLANSGGVDSVVLLHKFLRKFEPSQLVVAHFDHGIRADSAEDARFVRQLASYYELPFETRREVLGAKASEALARERRYTFLAQVARHHQAQLVTAHHMNDVAETVAINLIRGTGWRGLAVLDSNVYRPLLNQTKQELLRYATKHRLDWREDSTNHTDAYLRNRLRPRLIEDDLVWQLAALRARQTELRREIESELGQLKLVSPYERYFFTMIDHLSAKECLRRVTAGRLTGPQLEGVLRAVVAQRSGATYQAGGGIELSFTSRHFTVRMVS